MSGLSDMGRGRNRRVTRTTHFFFQCFGLMMERYDGGVERLEVKDHDRVGVESGLWLQGEGYTLRGLRIVNLRHPTHLKNRALFLSVWLFPGAISKDRSLVRWFRTAVCSPQVIFYNNSILFHELNLL